MKKQINDLLLKMQTGENCIGETANKLLDLYNVSVSLPTKYEVTSEGYRIAKDAGYNYRRVLKEHDHDIYYSGWMDCFDWISKGNEC